MSAIDIAEPPSHEMKVTELNLDLCESDLGMVVTVQNHYW